MIKKQKQVINAVIDEVSVNVLEYWKLIIRPNINIWNK